MLDHRPTVLETQKLRHWLVNSFFSCSLFLPFFSFWSPLPLCLFHSYFSSHFPSFHPVSPFFLLLSCTVCFAQHECSCKLICTANQIWVSVCQILGFIPATIRLWCSAAEFLIVISRHSAFLPAAALIYNALRFLLLLYRPSLSLSVTIPAFSHSVFSQSLYILNFIVNSWLLCDKTVCQSFPKWASYIFILIGPPGCRKSTDWLSVGQLWRHVGTDHWCLSERPAQSTNGGGSHFQRYSLFYFHFDYLSI